jgi:hypothetical protein
VAPAIYGSAVLADLCREGKALRTSNRATLPSYRPHGQPHGKSAARRGYCAASRTCNRNASWIERSSRIECTVAHRLLPLHAAPEAVCASYTGMCGGMNRSRPRNHPGGGAPRTPSTKFIFNRRPHLAHLTSLSVIGKSETRGSGNAQKGSRFHASAILSQATAGKLPLRAVTHGVTRCYRFVIPR